MKNTFYASLLIGISLTLVTTPNLAKVAQSPAKKQVSSSAKSTKTLASSKKREQATTSKKTSNTVVKQKPNQAKPHQLAKDSKHDKLKLVETKDSKHNKSKSHQLVDAKDSRHDKSKSHQHADAKDSKHSKSKLHQLADKDNKHSKSKSQQLADAKDSKHRRKNPHPMEEEIYEAENEEDAATAVEDDVPVQANEETDSVIEQSSSDDIASTDTGYYHEQSPETSSALIATPQKSSQLFFPPLDKNAPPPLTENRPDTTTEQHEEESAPLISAPEKVTPQIANNNRVHTLIDKRIDKSVPPNMIANSDEDNTPIQAPLNHQRIHSSIARGKINTDFIENATDNETSGHVASTHGIVDSSLAAAGEKAGLSDDMVVELTEIFAWDIDFANKLQAGAQFTVVYEQGNGNKANNQIIAAQFINQGKTYTAIRYKDKEGIVSYYTPEGRSLRKAFLSTPVDFARVSSHFSTHRKHPILNRIRAHKGVDYAARTGTPVKAAGDGIVTFHGTQGGYGRMIVLSHGEHYETAYAHLSNFRKDLQDGEPVKQGEVIGYVGQSGLATGPHLHYEFRVDGVHRDPENLDSKQAMRLAHDEWNNFHAQTIPVLTRLNQAKANTLFAKNQ